MSEQDAESEQVGHCSALRPRAVGKYLYVGEHKFLARGVTYGAFAPAANGLEYQDSARIADDFALMAANGINTVRIPHTTPPRTLLDEAGRHGLKVMVGLSLEQEIGFFIDRKRGEMRRVEELLRSRVRVCADHPALLCYALGNEISAPVARWIGRERVERLLERMCRMVKDEDPEALVTYVNYPTTEYLHLPFLDLLSFNVYLEAQDRLAVYLAKLQNIAGDRPLLMSELGLDALRNGEAAQAETLGWQIETSFGAGCAGVFVFSWTDEWHRAGSQVDDWAFGITTLERAPKPALAAVRAAFEHPLRAATDSLPAFTVIVCTYNGAATLRQCCEHIARLDYPDFEVVVVDDGSTDGSGDIAAEFGFRVVRTDHVGLSAARNLGAAAAAGELLAYIDDDAYPDRDWLRFLAASFADPGTVAAGGPNVSPPEDGWLAQCVDHSPGNPAHVLVTDTRAEQLPGCNLAVRRASLEAVGGFDPRFETAGDDVDMCWRLADGGGELAFSAGAMVLHHRRSSFRAYWRQQVGYGIAETMLAHKWRKADGDRRRAGTVYASSRQRRRGWFGLRVYHGVWGHAPFQSVYASDNAVSGLAARLELPLYATTLAALPLALLGTAWPRLGFAWLVLAVGIALIAVRAAGDAMAILRSRPRASTGRRGRWLAATAALHALQPAARLWGRALGLRRALRPDAAPAGWRPPLRRVGWVWSEDWIAPEQRIAALESELVDHGVPLTRGGNYDGWEFELHGGLCGGARVSIAVEDHSGAAQMVRYRVAPQLGAPVLAAGVGLGVLALAAWLDGAGAAAAVLALAAGVIAAGMLAATGRAVSWGLKALQSLGPSG